MYSCDVSLILASECWPWPKLAGALERVRSEQRERSQNTFRPQLFGTFWNTDLRTFTLTHPQKFFASPRQWLCMEVQHNFVVHRRRCLQTTNDESLAGDCGRHLTLSKRCTQWLASARRTHCAKRRSRRYHLHCTSITAVCRSSILQRTWWYRFSQSKRWVGG